MSYERKSLQCMISLILYYFLLSMLVSVERYEVPRSDNRPFLRQHYAAPDDAPGVHGWTR